MLEGDLLLIDVLPKDLLLGDRLLAEKDLLLDTERLLEGDLSLLDELEACLLLEGETILLLLLGLADTLPPRAGTSLSELLPQALLECLSLILSMLSQDSEVTSIIISSELTST